MGSRRNRPTLVKLTIRQQRKVYVTSVLLGTSRNMKITKRKWFQNFMTLTKESFFDRIKENLIYFPRNSVEEESKRIFSVLTSGILPEICFKNKEDRPECSGTILLECLKDEFHKNFILVFIFEDPESGFTLDDYFVFEHSDVDKVWDSVTGLLKSLSDRGPIHILSATGDIQREEKYGPIFDAWRSEIEYGE
jgi:hypothetical protein